MRRNGGMGWRETRKGLTSFRSLLALSLSLLLSFLFTFPSVPPSPSNLSRQHTLSSPPCLSFSLFLSPSASLLLALLQLRGEAGAHVGLRYILSPSLVFSLVPRHLLFIDKENLYTSYSSYLILNLRFLGSHLLSPPFSDEVACLMREKHEMRFFFSPISRFPVPRTFVPFD